jgi:tetratricopeptide (TPR) repeat protein
VLLLVSFLVAGQAESAARAADPPTRPLSDAPATDAEKQARALYAQGQIHYSLGEYEQAIAHFRGAYELTSAPGLLFNIAQAHRLNGQCKQALEIYRHFVRLAPSAEYRGEADTQIAALTLRCGTPMPTPSAGAETSRPAPKAEDTPATLLVASQPTAPSERPSRWSKQRRTATGLLAGGAAVGIAAGIVYRWNDGRYDQWRDEDQQLSSSPSGASGDAWIAAQQRNDTLLHSIQRTDTVSITLVGVSVAAVIASAVIAIIFER